MQRIQMKSQDPPFIYDTMLPTLTTTLDQILTVDLPSCVDPTAWIRTDAEHVDFIVQALSTVPQNSEIHHAHFTGETMIYRVSC